MSSPGKDIQTGHETLKLCSQLEWPLSAVTCTNLGVEP